MRSELSVDFRLYLITDRKLFTDSQGLFTAVEGALKAGVKAVQLREKDLGIRELLAMAYQMRSLTRRYGARLVVNDRVDVAICAEADGVHLGQSGMPVHAVRKVVGGRLMIGSSTHTLDEAVTAEKEGADFMTFGPLYETPSKLRYGKPVRLEELRRLQDSVTIPVFGIGGVGKEKVKEVLASGAHGVAVIRGILGAADTRAAAQGFLEALGG